MSSNDHHQPHRRPRPGPWPPGPTPAAAAAEPLSWAKRTGFKGRVSGESNASMNSGQIALPKSQNPEPQLDLESGRSQALPTPPVAAHPPAHPPPVNGEAENKPAVDPAVKRRRDSDGARAGPTKNVTNGPARPVLQQQQQQQPQQRHRRDEGLPQVHEEEGIESRQSHINYELRDSPGLVPIVFYGVQHYLSILGSLILIPLVIVPAMGGTVEDTAAVVSTVLFISGVTTLLHTFFGTRLSLIQGPSFVYLAPVLAIINSPEFQGLSGNNIMHIMKELQGALIISSAFQVILGYTGFMSLLLRSRFMVKSRKINFVDPDCDVSSWFIFADPDSISFTFIWIMNSISLVRSLLTGPSISWSST